MFGARIRMLGGMSLGRFLVSAMLVFAPLAPTYWLISLAERSEEHHAIPATEELAGMIARARQVQPPPPPTFWRGLGDFVDPTVDGDIVSGRHVWRPRCIRRIHYAPDNPDSLAS